MQMRKSDISKAALFFYESKISAIPRLGATQNRAITIFKGFKPETDEDREKPQGDDHINRNSDHCDAAV